MSSRLKVHTSSVQLSLGRVHLARTPEGLCLTVLGAAWAPGQLDAWVYDSTILPNRREFVDNGTLYVEEQPEQLMYGTTAHNAGQTRQVLNQTCTMPTLDKYLYTKLFTQFGNTSAWSSL